MNSSIVGNDAQKIAKISGGGGSLTKIIYNDNNSTIETILSEGKELIFFGAGDYCNYALNYFENNNIKMPVLICDNDHKKWGTTLNNIEIVSLDESLKRYENPYFVITNIMYVNEISNQLQKFVSKDRILCDCEFFVYQNIERINDIYNMLYDEQSKEIYLALLEARCTGNIDICNDLCVFPQYFPSDIIKIKEDEIFLDCGAYNGDTILMLEEISKGKYGKIISFEPNKDSYVEIEKMAQTNKKIQLVKKGVSDRNELVYFDNTKASSTSSIGEIGNIKIEVDSIDNVLNGKPATFIKMDIEGSEISALKGAVKTIQKYKPTLAISIYHKHSDFVDIPMLILGLDVKYNYYIRHHDNDLSETVLYAIPQ